MKTDGQIKQDILDELVFRPNIDETQIGVSVEEGVVTLSGTVNEYAKKVAAEKAAKSVQGVTAVAEDIEVKYGDDYKKSDKEIAKAAVDALKWNSTVPKEKVMVKVEDGYVYLSGEVSWSYQKNAAKRTVENLLGVKQVYNNISLEQKIKPYEVKERIKNAFERMADIDANGIQITTDDHKVILTGKVHSIKEKEDAEKAAYRAPGVYEVKNNIKVQFYTEYA